MFVAMTTTVAILDDYQQVWQQYADWSVLDGRVAVTSFADHLFDEDALAERLAPFRVVVAMRERTPFPASLLDRLPNLELLVTTGPFNAAIDIDHAAAKGIVVCGTGGALFNTAELTWALILGGALGIGMVVVARRQDKERW